LVVSHLLTSLEAANFGFTKGYGLEGSSYPNSRVLFGKLEHAYLLREYQNKMLEVCRTSDVSTNTWISDTAGWLSQVQTCLS